VQGKKRIVWIADLDIDLHLHAATEIEVLGHLAQRGHEVQLWAMRSISQHSKMERGVRLFCFPIRYGPLIQRTFFAVLLVFSLPIYLLSRKPQIVVTEPGWSILAFFWKILMPRSLCPKLVLDIRSTPVEVHDWRTALMGFSFKISVLLAKRAFDRITTITPFMKDDLVRDFHIRPEQIAVWSGGVSTALFDPSKHVIEGTRLRHKNRLSRAFVILYHGALTSHRGLNEVVKSIGMLKQPKYDHVVLFVLGSGPAAPNIRKLIEEYRLQGRVVLHQAVKFTDVPKYIAMSDIGIVPLPDIPDWRHQCPNNILEYLAMEKPMILTDLPGNRLIVGNSNCGIYVPSADPAEFCRAIMFACDRRAELRQWGIVGRGIAKRRYDWNVVAELFENIISS